ncbi:tRNA 2-thiouridine(34) synthase MnmA, partial [Anaplasma marginale]
MQFIPSPAMVFDGSLNLDPLVSGKPPEETTVVVAMSGGV